MKRILLKPRHLLLPAFFTMCFALSFIAITPATASYDDMPNELPDDAYKLYDKDNNHEITGSYGFENCDGPGGGGVGHGCIAGSNPVSGGNSHQYLTLSKGSINDDNSSGSFGGYLAKKIEIEIITTNPSNKSLALDMVLRSIDEHRGCQGYKIDVSYMDANKNLLKEGNDPANPSFYEDTITPQIYGGGCQHTYSVRHFPGFGFSVIPNIDGTPSGYYKGVIRLKLASDAPTSKQASFHFRTSGAKLGYVGTSDPAYNPSQFTAVLTGGSPSPPANDGWVNTYPTNGADKHEIQYRFSPPCGTPDNTPFVIAWDDLDVGGQFQPASQGPVKLRVTKEQRDGSNKSTVYSKTYNPPSGSGTFVTAIFDTKELRTDNYGASNNKPFVYTAEFSNIYGGNGITFRYPFPSSGFFLPCNDTIPKNWKLDNQTAVNPGIGAYSPASGDSTNTKSNKAKTAYQSARFYHAVQNLPASTGSAANNSHQSHIQYRLKRAASSTWRNSENGSTGSNAWVAKSTNQSKTLNPNASFLVDDDGATAGVSIPRSKELAYLLDDCTPGPDCQNSSPARAPTVGDQFCERVWTSPSTSTGGPVIHSPEVCITLGGSGATCFDWHVVGASGIREVNGANAPIGGNLGNSVPDAWVGDRYGYYYAFGKTGYATKTGTINFYHNPVSPPTLTHSQQLGTWTTAYYRGIAASDGGKLLTDQINYAPTDGYTNCLQANFNILANAIYVPYYYHLKPTSGNVSSKTQQGDPISPQLTVNLPPQDNQGDLTGDAAADNENNGRKHTWSAPTNWRIIEFKTTDINDAKNKIPKNKSTNGAGTCAEMNSFAIAGFSGCGTVVAQNNKVFAGGNATLSYTRPAQLDPVGTNVCYVGVLNRPSHNASPNSRYSNVSCTTIVKSPKTQFLNGDLTVGRHRLGDGGSPCHAPDTTAPIQATGAPSGVSLLGPAGSNPNRYGSWVEYGAFATGNISGFGSAAYAQTSTAVNAEKKLMFANTPSSGNYTYAAQCLSDSFSLVKEPNVNYIDAQAGTLRLNEFFSTPPYNNAAADKTGYVANNAAGTNAKNIIISRPLSATPYTATVTIRAAAQGLNLGPDKAPPTMRVIMRQGDGTPVAQTVAVNTTAPNNYTLNFDLGSSLGYKGPGGLRIEYINDYYGADGDRNLLLSNITVKFNNNGASNTFNPTDNDPAKTRRLYQAASGDKCYTAPQSIQSGMLWLPSDTTSSVGDGGLCYGYDLTKSDLGLGEVAAPAGGLDDSFSAFKGRDIILYAKKSAGACGSGPTVGGNITIDSDINYAKLGYTDIAQLPRIILMADCKIIINDDVRQVDAWLIAKDAVETCSEATGDKFTARTVTQFDCAGQLMINGPVQAKRLLVWRTHGADLTLGDRAEPAEVFNLRPDQLLATYARGRDAGKPQTVYQTDLPPLY